MATSPVLMKSDSIADNMPEALREKRYLMKRCFAHYAQQGKRLMKLHHLMEELDKSIDDQAERTQVLEGTLGCILCSTQEAAVVPPYIGFAVRPNPGYWEYVKVNANDLTVEGINATEYPVFFNRKWNELRFKVLGLKAMGRTRTAGCKASCGSPYHWKLHGWQFGCLAHGKQAWSNSG